MFFNKKIKIYNDILNPIKLFDGYFIFSSIMDKNKIRILLFSNQINNTLYKKIYYCEFHTARKYQSLALIKKYGNILDKNYYNMFCPLPKYYNEKYKLFISSIFIPVNNYYQKGENYNLLFCLTTVFNYNNTNRFIEFVEYYRNFGVDKFVIYNTNCSKDIKKIFIYYKMIGIMDILFDNFTHNLFERKKFHLWKHNDCFHRYKYSAKRIIFTDHDEIIYSSIYNSSESLFVNLNQHAASYYFYPKLTITKGKGFFVSGNYSVCPNKLWKYVINKPYCISHVNIHFVILKRKCFSSNIPYNVAAVIHARNEQSYHAKACKLWKYENNYYSQKKILLSRTMVVEKQVLTIVGG